MFSWRPLTGMLPARDCSSKHNAMRNRKTRPGQIENIGHEMYQDSHREGGEVNWSGNIIIILKI